MIVRIGQIWITDPHGTCHWTKPYANQKFLVVNYNISMDHPWIVQFPFVDDSGPQYLSQKDFVRCTLLEDL